MSESNNDKNWENSHDRLPSEVFTAIAALQNNGTKAEVLKRRADAIEILLDLLLSYIVDEDPKGTLYDDLAILAFKEEIIPPKKSKGRPTPDALTASGKTFRKMLIRLEYSQLRKSEPHLSAAKRLEFLADKYKTDEEVINNIVRASKSSLKVSRRRHPIDPNDPKRALDMWKRWEASEKSRKK